LGRGWGGTATAALADQANDETDGEALHAFVRELVPRLEGIEQPEVVAVDWNVADYARFVDEHRVLYADPQDLGELRDVLSARMAWERAHANPFYLDLEGEVAPDPSAVIDRMRTEADQARARLDRFPDGFYESADGTTDLVFVRAGIRGGEASATDALIAAIEAAATEAEGVPALATRSAGTDVGWVGRAARIDYGGELMDMREENAALEEAVARSSLLTAMLLLASIWIFFSRFRAVPLLGLVLVPPCLVTFGIAEHAVDFLNASSAFLGSIVVGNGVNPSIMWLGRYFEERRAGRTVAQAIDATHRGTWAGTLAATMGAALAYGSLLVTDYRGFRDFGFIGGIGMLLAWMAAMGLLPALVTLTERRWPMVFRASELERRGVYGVAFARLVLSRPGTLLAACAIVSIGAAIAIGSVAASDPLEYDFRNLQADRAPESRVAAVNELVAEIVEETRAGSALAILAPSPDDVPHLRAELEAYAAAHPGSMGAVRTLDDLLPRDGAAAAGVAGELRTLALEARPFMDEAHRREIDRSLPPAELSLVGAEDLPASVARPFTERDGTRGRLLFVEHADGEDLYDGRYMITWAEAVRSARTASGAEPAIGGGAVVFADLLTTIFDDGPRAIAASLLATVLVLLLAFRRMRERALALASMLVGVLMMVGVLAALGVKLNFLNMVALPITFGIGTEYGVNFVKRFLEERVAGPGGIEGAVQRTLEGAGGAVVLCSLTTLIGYISLYASANRALNSFGLAMSIGEVTCLVSSLVALPALLVVVARWREAPRATSVGERSTAGGLTAEA